MSGIEAFSTVASAYEDWFASPLGAFVDQAEQQALTLALPQDKVNAMLEVGAGTGHIARLLTQYAHQVVAVEPSPAMRAEGQRRLTDLPVQWQAARAEQLPFPDAQFDGVVLFTTLEFVEHPQAALQEALRVVRPGGWLIVGLLQALSAWAAFYRYKGDRGAMPWAAARFYTPEEVESWVGFPAEQVESAVYLAPKAKAPYAVADQAGQRAGNAPALEVLRWRKPR